LVGSVVVRKSRILQGVGPVVFQQPRPVGENAAIRCRTGPSSGSGPKGGSFAQAPQFRYAPTIGLAQRRDKASNETGIADTYVVEIVTRDSLIGKIM